MLRIGICEDEPADLAHLREVMEGVLAELEIAAVTEIYDSGERLLAAIQSGVCYDLLLLDIYMEGLDGIATARQARMLLPRVQLAFLTTAREFAIDAFDLDAVHYLLKPVEAKGLRVLFERYFSRVRRPVKMLCLENAKDALHLPMQRINKVQSANRGVDIYLEQETQPLFFAATFASTEEKLDPRQFLRLSRGLIVNMAFILSLDDDTCRLKDGTEVLISRREKAEVRRRYNDFMFRKLEERP